MPIIAARRHVTARVNLMEADETRWQIVTPVHGQTSGELGCVGRFVYPYAHENDSTVGEQRLSRMTFRLLVPCISDRLKK